MIWKRNISFVFIKSVKISYSQVFCYIFTVIFREIGIHLWNASAIVRNRIFLWRFSSYYCFCSSYLGSDYC